VEIRGRMNCGPCCEGDEVVVKLRKIFELDKKSYKTGVITYRGTVVAVLKQNVRRRAHTFLCRVDAFHAHLMKPIDNIAPKIHVVKSVIAKNYPDRRQELVAKYEMHEGQLELRKIIKLDPKKRRDMLFVVKYLRWNASKMYPLGYVSKVINAGSNLEKSQTILNLLYQVSYLTVLFCIILSEIVHEHY